MTDEQARLIIQQLATKIANLEIELAVARAELAQAEQVGTEEVQDGYQS